MHLLINDLASKVPSKKCIYKGTQTANGLILESISVHEQIHCLADFKGWLMFSELDQCGQILVPYIEKHRKKYMVLKNKVELVKLLQR